MTWHDEIDALAPVRAQEGRVHDQASLTGPPEHRAVNQGTLAHWLTPMIDPTAIVNAFCTVDAGIREPTRIGARSFVMAGCHIAHDVQVGADCELAPHVVLLGHVVVEDGVRIGGAAVVRPGVRIGRGARIGCGACVIRDVPAGETWVGNPAHLLYPESDPED